MLEQFDVYFGAPAKTSARLAPLGPFGIILSVFLPALKPKLPLITSAPRKP